MKTTTSILLGCLLIAAALVVAGNAVAQNLGMASSLFPGSIEVYNRDSGGAPLSAEHMTDWEASQYCRIDHDAFLKLLNEGKLRRTYIEIQVERAAKVDEDTYNDMLQDIPGGDPSSPPPVTTVSGIERVFVRARLDEWMIAQIAP